MHHSIWTNLNSFVSSIFALFGWAEAAGWADSRWDDQPSRSAPASRSTPLGAALLNGPSSWLPPPGGLTSSYPHFPARTVPASHQPSVPNRGIVVSRRSFLRWTEDFKNEKDIKWSTQWKQTDIITLQEVQRSSFKRLSLSVTTWHILQFLPLQELDEDNSGFPTKVSTTYWTSSLSVIKV